jgi:hypothetical protein
MVQFTGKKAANAIPFPEQPVPSAEKVVRLVGAILNSTRAAQLKSEESLPGQTGPLFKLVGKDWKGAVGDPRLDVLTAILVGPESERNATLALVNETALELERQQVRTVKCYWIDLELNELPDVDTGNWTAPVLLLWPAGDAKTPISFDKISSFSDLLRGIKKNGKSKFRIGIPKERRAEKKDENL